MLQSDTGSVELTASYLSDGLGDLVRSAAALLRGPEQMKATVHWMEEPGEHRWLIDLNEDSIGMRILWFEETFSCRSNDEGRLELVANGRLPEFAGQVKSQFERLLTEHGADGYAQLWGHDFPFTDYAVLAALLRERKRRGRT